MKKLLAVLAAAVMCLSMGAAVSADVIIEPTDSFYETHRNEIKFLGDGRVGRRYILTGETDVFDDPGGKRTGILSEGKSPWIYYIYTDKDGKAWGGYFEMPEMDQLNWICLDGLEPVYDNYSFMEEHKDSITKNTDKEYNSLRAEGTIYLWNYPGSTEKIPMETHPDDFGSYISELYTDETGGKWGYIGYIWGERGWIYITDPSDSSPFSEDVSSGAMMTDSIYKRTSSAGGFTAAAILALAAAAGSAGLIAVLKKKDGSGTDKSV